jgi:hypothetical protein
MKTKPAFVFWSGVSFLVILDLLIFDYIILSSPPHLRVQFTPDDMYYYLQLAKNYEHYGYWTFDSGISTASGFHLLLAYTLVVLHKIFQPSTETFVTMGILLSSTPALLLVIIVWWKSVRAKNTTLLLALALFAATQSFLLNTVSGVEWSLVIVLAALYCYLLNYSSSSPGTLLKLFAAGLYLSLARSDTGLLPFSIFVTVLVFTVLTKGSTRSLLRNALSGFAGAIVGVAITLLHNYIFTGNLIQSSARMKLHWAGFQDHLLARSVLIPARVIGFDVYLFPLPPICLSFLFFVTIVAMAAFFLRGKVKASKAALEIGKTEPYVLLWTASHVCVVAYVLLYARAGGIQNWYTANFLVPMFIVIAGWIDFLGAQLARKRALFEAALSMIVLITLSLNLLTVYPVSRDAPWPHQQAMLDAGKYLNENPPDGRIASWNAGIVGYYQGGMVINIDGLVNESVYPYVVKNQLPRYLEREEIRFLVDFQTMLHPIYRQRGGYDDPDFLDSLVPVFQFDHGEFSEWKYLTLYRIVDE